MELDGEKLIVLPIPQVFATIRQCRFLFGPNDQIICRPPRSVPYTQPRGILRSSKLVLVAQLKTTDGWCPHD
jgi:hypothetical protein